MTPDDLPELLQLMLASVEQTLQKSTALDSTQVEMLAIEIVRDISEKVGGMQCYVPRNVAFQRHARYQGIWRDFDGRNHAALAIKYGMSTQWVYQVIKRLKANSASNQFSPPLDEQSPSEK
jgi:Mor family transcriptional regulator